MVIMLSSFDKCFVGKNLLLDRKENGVQEDIQDTRDVKREPENR